MLLNLFIKAQNALMTVKSRFEDEDGVIAVEYIIMLVLVALAIVAGATVLGSAINDKLSSASTRVSTCC